MSATAAPPDDAPHVLVVDDDRRLRQLVASYLGRNGYRVTAVASAAEASARLASLAFELIVLDVMMPGENGFDFAERLRESSDIPILMLTARGDASDRVRGLEAGVDDYLSKPYEPKELLLRIGSILRRTRAVAPAPSADEPGLRFGPFLFLPERGELRKGEALVRLTERERDILRLLGATPGVSVSREALSGGGGGGQERTIDVQINRLRRKLEDDPANPLYLQTARGAGYKLVADP
ncbi:MAG: response regulator transcription factor [Pseudomonadota bacterium]|nr:response regulator transcription factor [Pseudomonadota bacterium]